MTNIDSTLLTHPMTTGTHSTCRSHILLPSALHQLFVTHDMNDLSNDATDEGGTHINVSVQHYIIVLSYTKWLTWGMSMIEP